MEQHQNMSAHNAMQAFNQMQQINQQTLSTLSSQFSMTTTPFCPPNIQSTPMFAAGTFDQTSSSRFMGASGHICAFLYQIFFFPFHFPGKYFCG
jgi:hypothetical protein